MRAYYVAQVSITDEELYREVQSRFAPVFSKFSGRVIAADPNFEVIDGVFDADRVVIIEFPSEEELKAWYYSPEYQETVALRKRAAHANIVVVHGLEK